jgi:hypothetical protein
MSNRSLEVMFGVIAIGIALAMLGVSLGSVALFAIVLVCPLMMYFMMRSMGGTCRDARATDSRDRDRQGSVG